MEGLEAAAAGAAYAQSIFRLAWVALETHGDVPDAVRPIRDRLASMTAGLDERSQNALRALPVGCRLAHFGVKG